MSSKYYASGGPSEDNSGSGTSKNTLGIDCNRCKSSSSPMSDEGCSSNVSPYSSSSEDDAVIDKTTTYNNIPRQEYSTKRDKVVRSSSSDSALGLDEDVQPEPKLSSSSIKSGRRMTLTVEDIPLRAALLPLASPNSLPDPDSPINQLPIESNATNVPSKIILEASIVEIPSTFVQQQQQQHHQQQNHTDEDDQSEQLSDLRRVSSQSDIIDHRVRYVRTPSVVVSDYSDDIYGGISLEDIEFLRRQRLRRASLQDIDHYDSEVSAASSCSNLDFVGSTISGLDTIDDLLINSPSSGLDTPERKTSDCSTCSTNSGDEHASLPIQLTKALEKEQQKKVR